MDLEQPPSPVEKGRRARRVAAMRDRLIQISLDRFDGQGFRATTIDQIAADAEVHRSTFFRYFDSKEAVLFAPLAGSNRWFLEALAQRPRGEPLIRSVTAVCTGGAWPSVDRERLRCIHRITSADPSLHDAVHAHRSSAFAPLLADRLRSLDPAASDREIALVSSLCLMWSNAAFSALIEQGGDLQQYFAAVIADTRDVARQIPDDIEGHRRR